jgi:hypothetical protein
MPSATLIGPAEGELAARADLIGSYVARIELFILTPTDRQIQIQPLLQQRRGNDKDNQQHTG